MKCDANVVFICDVVVLCGVGVVFVEFGAVRALGRCRLWNDGERNEFILRPSLFPTSKLRSWSQSSGEMPLITEHGGKSLCLGAPFEPVAGLSFKTTG